MRDRIYIWDEAEKRLKPAWGENTPGGHAATGRLRGEIVVGISGETRSKAVAALERERVARQTPVVPHDGPVCGNPMRMGETCARLPNHRGDHSTRWALDNRAAGRRRAA